MVILVCFCGCLICTRSLQLTDVCNKSARFLPFATLNTFHTEMHRLCGERERPCCLLADCRKFSPKDFSHLSHSHTRARDLICQRHAISQITLFRFIRFGINVNCLLRRKSLSRFDSIVFFLFLIFFLLSSINFSGDF